MSVCLLSGCRVLHGQRITQHALHPKTTIPPVQHGFQLLAWSLRDEKGIVGRVRLSASVRVSVTMGDESSVIMDAGNKRRAGWTPYSPPRPFPADIHCTQDSSFKDRKGKPNGPRCKGAMPAVPRCSFRASAVLGDHLCSASRSEDNRQSASVGIATFYVHRYSIITSADF